MLLCVIYFKANYMCPGEHYCPFRIRRVQFYLVSYQKPGLGCRVAVSIAIICPSWTHVMYQLVRNAGASFYYSQTNSYLNILHWSRNCSCFLSYVKIWGDHATFEEFLCKLYRNGTELKLEDCKAPFDPIALRSRGSYVTSANLGPTQRLRSVSLSCRS